jgi:hypothetical protein
MELSCWLFYIGVEKLKTNFGSMYKQIFTIKSWSGKSRDIRTPARWKYKATSRVALRPMNHHFNFPLNKTDRYSSSEK